MDSVPVSVVLWGWKPQERMTMALRGEPGTWLRGGHLEGQRVYLPDEGEPALEEPQKGSGIQKSRAKHLVSTGLIYGVDTLVLQGH